MARRFHDAGAARCAASDRCDFHDRSDLIVGIEGAALDASYRAALLAAAQAKPAKTPDGHHAPGERQHDP